ncbi:DNA replication licensing factor MCM6 [Babesia sp. Xinjiang]|uniref:DNA replication licensing factor MCM6 n=1 Tax=Babesia sp. Xinjiang TaxID=462227 RepID=UPI000A262F04|nr:DNA replication licensing factor MCM6 [Babesia sp. Xinjiang]ORM41800.1 DNA replication licensing factor MCM6 [Babesia sp. Xinjiang]
MFKCRVCSIVPFASFLGLVETGEDDDKPHVRRQVSYDDDLSPSMDGSVTSCSVSDNEAARDRRSAEEVAYLVKAWDTYVHERAKALWKTPAKRYSILAGIAKDCARSDDPVLGNDVSCVRWHGATDNGNPVITVSRPGEAKGSTTYVSRMLVFLFAGMDSVGVDPAVDRSTAQRRSQLLSMGLSPGLDMSSEEETLQIQDANISSVFDLFLRTYVADGAQEYDEDLEEFYDELSDDEDITDNNISRTETGQPLFYMKRIFTLVSRMSHLSEVLVVHLDHVLRWRPLVQDPSLNLNVQLYHYLVKYFLRVHDVLEDRLQLIVDALAYSINRESKKVYLQFLHTPSVIYRLKDVRCHMLGELISIRGQVTRTSDVRPELIRATFKCKSCGGLINDIRQNFRYTLPTKCTTNNCLNLHEWELVMEQSQFCDWQKVRIQEMAQESGAGSMPRSIDVVLRHRTVDRLNAGDRVVVSGALIVLPDVPTLLKPGEMPRKVNKQAMRRFESHLISQGLTGIKGVGVKDLNHKLSFLATQVRRINDFKAPSNEVPSSNDDHQVRGEDILRLPNFEWVRRIAESPNTIDRLAASIAPNIWGHAEVKKGVLLMMVGGVHKSSSNSKLRGDINVCLVGDPSTAKSQFLKFVENFAPRAIYTSGKGSTAAGLTAAVHRDPDSGEFVLEAGALMYADQGICCIDEFDKMNDRDRVAIHEAMEQQTISIAKAGIQATLNARASVLAVCNPRYGRYDPSKSFASNVNLPPPLLSRFDLLYTLLDEAEEGIDSKIAWHITGLHGPGAYKSSELLEDPEKHDMEEEPFEQEFSPPLTLDELKLYIELAKRIKPLMHDDAKHKLAHYYVALRNGDAQASKRSVRITVRQLESLVRLSEAVARLKFSDLVEESHVDEAYEIFNSSLLRLSNKELVVLDPNTTTANGGMTQEDMEQWKERLGLDETKESANDDFMRIGMNEYQAISAVLIDRVSEHELLEEEVASNELVEWYVQNIVVPRTPEDADAWNLRLQRVVHRLVYVDKKLLARRRKDDIPNVFRLRVHPNYYSSAHIWKRDTTVEVFDVEDAQETEGEVSS